MTAQPATAVVAARRDPALVARVVREVPLRYAAGPDARADRPAHVRAASGLAVVRTPAGLRLAVVQDDAHWLALVDPATGLADAVALPPGPGGRRLFETGRGNKLDKLDLESCLVLDDPERPGASLLVAFGSGSLPVRERIVVVRGLERGTAEVRVIDATRLYALLRGLADFAGAELNVEGAARVHTPEGPVVRLFARGNGAAAELEAELAAGAASGSATCDLPLDAFVGYLLDPAAAPAPPPWRVTRYSLGLLDGEPLGFTDAAPWGEQGDSVLYLAAAERSANAIEDGPVAGSVLGVLGADGQARWAPLVEASGAPFTRKAEGVAPAGEGADGEGRVWIVLDVDDPTRPAALCEVALAGGWGVPPADRR